MALNSIATDLSRPAYPYFISLVALPVRLSVI